MFKNLYRLYDKIQILILSKGYLKNYKLKKGDTVLDLGAFFGSFSIIAAKKVGPSGKVIAYEPDKRNFEILKQNVKESGLKNIVIVNKAIFDKKATLNLSSSFSSSNLFNKNLLNTNKIQADTIDNELKRLNIKKVDFVKMDVEGAEIEVMNGAKNNLKNIKNFAIACYHKRNGKTTGELLKPFFEKKGFKASIGFFIHPTLYVNKFF
ncbi:MAG: FkbM family methyltransferase [Candidatus Nanoarchaeia archaeon]|nr:FkbM family methyltransferase [Candidatus Nanoarchaeia archaeon]